MKGEWVWMDAGPTLAEYPDCNPNACCFTLSFVLEGDDAEAIEFARLHPDILAELTEEG